MTKKVQFAEEMRQGKKEKEICYYIRIVRWD